MQFYIGFLVIILILIVAFLIYLAYDYFKHPKEWSEYNAQVKAKENEETKAKQEMRCPKCGNTQLYVGKRGWKVTTGFIGSSTVMVTCPKCGYHWRAGK